MNPYEKLIARKRKWTPVQTTAGELVEGAEGTVLRALALRCLELPVGEFISNSLKGDIPEEARLLLEMNITDEETTMSHSTMHPLQLDMMLRLKEKRRRSERLGKIIQTTPLSKQWFWRGVSSSRFCHSLGRSETLD